MRMGFKARVGGVQWAAREELRFGSPILWKIETVKHKLCAAKKRAWFSSKIEVASLEYKLSSEEKLCNTSSREMSGPEERKNLIEELEKSRSMKCYGSLGFGS
jgi:hypothetical protein